MAITKFTQQKDDAFDDVQRLMCSVPGCQNRWSVQTEGEKPKCSKHQWQKTEVRSAVKSWHEVGEDL
tara:strand:+ start:906 stop:1106 length:201 start_codon:yes stop_codon:yes gene_type:complete